MLTNTTKAQYAYDSVEEAFPEADPGAVPCGSRVLVQIRTPKKRTSGKIILVADTVETDKWNTQAAKVIAIGPVAFHNRNTLEPWPEGDWCRPGDFVRVPKYGGDRWEVKIGDSEEEALFVIVNDLDITARITGDPRSMKAFI